MSSKLEDKCKSSLSSTLSSCGTQCSTNTLNSPNCVDCLCQQCENLSNLGQDVTDEARECCKDIKCKKKKQYDDFKGCFENCSGNVDSSSYTSEIFSNCCNSTSHQACCLKSCLTSGAYQLTNRTLVSASARDESDPVSKYCKGKEVFRSSNVTAYDNMKPFCRQSSEKSSESSLFDCACRSGNKPCLDALDYETCTLLNSQEIMKCLTSKGGQDLINGKNELDGLFCNIQNMGFPCRSCLICNYLNHVNPDLKASIDNLVQSSSTNESIDTTPTPKPSKNFTFLWILSGGLLILIFLIIMFLLNKKLKK